MRLKINDANLDKIVEAVDRIAETLSHTVLEKWEINIVDYGNVDTAAYISSLQIERISNGRWVIYSDIEHAPYVEYGTGPASDYPDASHEKYIPPFPPILKWVEHKLGYSGDHAKAVAWFIINKIKSEGTDPKPSARDALQQTKYISLKIGKGILEKVCK